jgi:electron transfer flavoprotein beta subunit
MSPETSSQAPGAQSGAQTGDGAEAGEGGALEIVVCMKAIIDPEVPHHTFAIDQEAKRAVPPMGLPPVVSPFDENALEAALRLKDQAGCNVTVLSLGKSIPKTLLQTALAAGADRAIAVEDAQFDDLDPFTTAAVLAQAVSRAGGFDLVFTGRQAADWDAGLVWAGIAEHLDLPCVTVAQKAELRDRGLLVERCVSDGIEIVESELPALVTFSNEAGELRNVSVAALMGAKRKEIVKWSAADLGFERATVMQLEDLSLPVLEIVDRYMVGGQDGQEKGRNLARKLAADGIIERAD